MLLRQRNIYREMAHMRNTRRRRVATFRNTDFEVRSKFRPTCFILCGAVCAAGGFYFGVFFAAASDKRFKGKHFEIIFVFGVGVDLKKSLTSLFFTALRFFYG